MMFGVYSAPNIFSINERTPEKEAILGVKKPKKSAGKPKTAKRTNSKK